jgi:hypothetical protein
VGAGRQADKLTRLQKTVMRFVKEAEEQMDVKEWAQDELGQLTRKAYIQDSAAGY